ncbi:Phox-like protein [Sistotremastrum suecicum HHB10207 ss-3]|uniref:Endosomal/vacuolar adapter protein YPT35 n=1 Tax=Sistotremastrum suecicum HHB10207 ss-3 TaxID=1314776 RepID=A0A165Y5N7_9AGAM|nr:Phox-like protein [Sistotremastrum suecicum HHB10207 ss-3]
MASLTNAPTQQRPSHPFAGSKGLLIVVPRDHIDVEEEADFYDQFTEDKLKRRHYNHDLVDTRSIISDPDIQIQDNRTPSTSDFFPSPSLTAPFAQNVKIDGWTTVGDKDPTGGGYIVFDCRIITREGITIHIYKRYSSFARLRSVLRNSVPPHLRVMIPPLPPKSPLSKFRQTFLATRRQELECWLAFILLHPDLGGRQEVKNWVTKSE